MKKTGFRSLLLLTLSLVLVLAGCGSAAKSGEGGSGGGVQGEAAAPTKISFWAAAVTPERNAFFEQIIQEFEQQNPDIEVDYLGVPGDLSGYEQKVNVAISAGQAPDIMNDFKADLITRDVLE
ncbi:MAG: extracellular solute-binding protein, partial [Paenibacillus macerans]|nr:extracellular solute-binding protein [Paenibacillus macerans]